MTADWRLLIDAPGDGAWNMAVDEAILQRYALAVDPPPPTLRLYGWEPAAVSLGKSQRVDPPADLAALRRAGVDLVRRPTGGRAVFHRHERTYAIVGAVAPPFTGGILESYLLVARALEVALRTLGVEVAIAPCTRSRPAQRVDCFDSTSAYEITTAQGKLVGSAQLRRRRGWLQHGSIRLRAAETDALAAIGARPREERVADLAGCLGEEPDPRRVDRALVQAFERSFGRALVPGTLLPEELDRATRLRCWRYDSAAWTLQGRPGERERRWGPDLD